MHFYYHYIKPCYYKFIIKVYNKTLRRILVHFVIDHKNLNKNGSFRTIGTIKNNFLAWKAETGGDFKKAKHYSK